MSRFSRLTRGRARGPAGSKPTDRDREHSTAGSDTPAEPDRPATPVPPAAVISAERESAVATAVRDWTAALVDLGGTNNLLWQADPEGSLDIGLAHPAGLSKLLSGAETRLDDLFREPTAYGQARNLLSRIRTHAEQLMEERGLTTCFLALGSATWPAPHPTRVPDAPVLLRPCTIRTSGYLSDDLSLEIGPECEFNRVLAHYLSSAERVLIDVGRMDDLACGSGDIDPQPVYAALIEATSEVPGFRVAESTRIGTFTYSKAALVADLSARAGSLPHHDLVAALAGDPQATASARDQPGADSSTEAAATAALVLDADPSQLAALARIEAGASVIIDAPPGSGGTQTIANIIARAVAQGERVLVVAERARAIEALRERLAEVGLDELMLPFTDGPVGRRFAVATLATDLERVRGAAEYPPMRTSAARHQVAHDELARHHQALHEVRQPWGVSAFEVIDAVTRSTGSLVPARTRVRLSGQDLRRLRRDEVESQITQLEELARAGAWDQPSTEDPWFGAALTSAHDVEHAQAVVAELAGERLREVRDVIDEVFTEIATPTLPTVQSWGRLVTTVADVRNTLELFRRDIFDSPLRTLVEATGDKAAMHERMGWWTRRRLRGQARRLLRPGRPPADLHAALEAASRERQAWKELAGPGSRPQVPAEIDRAEAAYRRLAADLTWLDSVLSHDGDRPHLLDLPVERLHELAGRLSAAGDRLRVLPHVAEPLAAARTGPLGALVEDLAARAVPADQVRAEVELAWWSSLAQECVLGDPRLTEVDGDRLRLLAGEFVDTDAAVLAAAARLARGLALERARAALSQHAQGVRALEDASAGSGRTRLSDLLSTHADLVLALRPVLAMSPLVVPAALPEDLTFDLVVIDGAEALTTAAAVPAIARGRRTIVVGDRLQGSPAGFQTATGAAASAVEGARGPSILDGLADLLPRFRLREHYRALDDRAVELVRAEVYPDALRATPAPALAHPVRLVWVDGSGMPGAGSASVETTADEVDAVVAQVLEHARERSERSLGVITLGELHADRVEQALRRALSTSGEEITRFFDPQRPEPFFIRSAVHAVGEERDDVIVAVGFGRTPHGRVLHSFGPLSSSGGAAWLVVALTRARGRVTLVTTLRSGDLDPHRLVAPGVRLLRSAIAHAERVQPRIQVPSSSGGLLAQLAQRLAGKGLAVHDLSEHAHESGVDAVGVEDPHSPGALRVAVVLDGLRYAAGPTVRDRERIWVERLERAGFEVVRVWAVDAFRSPAKEVSRVLSVLDWPPEVEDS